MDKAGQPAIACLWALASRRCPLLPISSTGPVFQVVSPASRRL
jgi:hypothetical protein